MKLNGKAINWENDIEVEVEVAMCTTCKNDKNDLTNSVFE